MRAQKIGKVAAKVGFDFDSIDSAAEKIGEEAEEAAEALVFGDSDKIEEELGDLLFAVVNVCRLSKIDAEEALTRANNKFVGRFRALEEELTVQGKDFSDCTMAEMDTIWDEIKKKHQKN